jgi:hypothetical protein
LQTPGFLRQKADRWFTLFLLLTAVLFFALRPLTNPSQPVIAGDGLGYYAYLPALFIYEDDSLQYHWFNSTHDRYYSHSIFPDPEDNFVVQYEGRRINKYYPGLALAWLPFFLGGHFAAIVSGVPADGFSAPYQSAVGIASLFYLLLGLYYLKRLLQSLDLSPWVAAVVPVVLFAATRLYAFGIFVNSLTHVYSFCFVTAFLFYAVRFGRSPDLHALCSAGFFLLLAMSVRPLDALIILAVPAYVNAQTIRKMAWRNIRYAMLPVFGLAVVLICQMAIIYRQTGSLLPYTYPGEGFHWGDSRFVQSLTSYHMGLFVYTPVLLLSLGGMMFLPPRARWWTATCFFAAVFVYSSWWYWHIVPRGAIDFYAIPAIWLGAFLSGVKRTTARVIAIGLCVISALYYQLKNYQQHTGALDHWTTSRELFRRNFFRLEKAWYHAVPESVVEQHEKHTEDFEALQGPHVRNDAAAGSRCLSAGPENYITSLLRAPLPSFAAEQPEHTTLRFNLRLKGDPRVGAVHFFVRLLDESSRQVAEYPFYLNKGDVPADEWDLREFGFRGDAQMRRARYAELVVWNVEAKHELLVDNVTFEAFLTNDSFETIP